MSDAPWFSVGEEVILQSITYPIHNGIHVIRQVLDEFEFTKCRLTGDVIGPSRRWSYVLEEPLADPWDEGRECIWNQSALRKKHKPSDESFETMMESLKTVSV